MRLEPPAELQTAVNATEEGGADAPVQPPVQVVQASASAETAAPQAEVEAEAAAAQESVEQEAAAAKTSSNAKSKAKSKSDGGACKSTRTRKRKQKSATPAQQVADFDLAHFGEALYERPGVILQYLKALAETDAEEFKAAFVQSLETVFLGVTIFADTPEECAANFLRGIEWAATQLLDVVGFTEEHADRTPKQ